MCDVIARSQDINNELTERTGTLRESHDEVVLQAFVDQRSLSDLFDSPKVVIAAADQTGNGLFPDAIPTVFERGKSLRRRQVRQ